MKTKQSSEQFTPGPWTVQPKDKNIIAPNGEFVAQVFETDSVPVGNDYHKVDLPQEANARLIAAAPELLKAAKAGLACANRFIEDDTLHISSEEKDTYRSCYGSILAAIQAASPEQG